MWKEHNGPDIIVNVTIHLHNVIIVKYIHVHIYKKAFINWNTHKSTSMSNTHCVSIEGLYINHTTQHNNRQTDDSWRNYGGTSVENCQIRR